jgi:serine/threonine protein kinase
MLSAVLYCHQHGVVHRDIKLDNFIYEHEARQPCLATPLHACRPAARSAGRTRVEHEALSGGDA